MAILHSGLLGTPALHVLWLVELLTIGAVILGVWTLILTLGSSTRVRKLPGRLEHSSIKEPTMDLVDGEREYQKLQSRVQQSTPEEWLARRMKIESEVSNASGRQSKLIELEAARRKARVAEIELETKLNQIEGFETFLVAIGGRLIKVRQRVRPAKK